MGPPNPLTTSTTLRTVDQFLCSRSSLATTPGLAIADYPLYRYYMGQRKGLGRDRASRIGETLAEMSAAASAFRAGWRKGGTPTDPHERMVVAYEKQQQDHQKSVVQYQGKLKRLRNRVRYMSAAAVIGAGAALADLLVAGPEGIFFIGAPVAVLGAVSARGASKSLTALEPPETPTAPPPPPRPLPPGVVGAEESVHLHRVRLQLASLIPTIADLHEDAALELRRADFEAAPALAMLVERLNLLNQVSAEMTGTPAQRTAVNSAQQVRARLAQGVQMYDELLNAALQMLSAPDPRRAPSAALETAVQELASYTEGLHVAELAGELSDPPAGAPGEATGP